MSGALRGDEAFVVRCVQENRINELVHGARDGRVTVAALNQYVKTERAGLDALRALLRVTTRGGIGAQKLRRTTLVHELCRSASRALLRWVFVHAARNGADMSLFHEPREPLGADTPLHELAKRPAPAATAADERDNDTWEALMRDIFARHSSDEALAAQNKDGITPLHFVALLHESLSDDIRRREHTAAAVAAARGSGDGDTAAARAPERGAEADGTRRRRRRRTGSSLGAPAPSADSLRAERLTGELLRAKSENKQLRARAESAQAAHDDIEAQQVRLREQMVAQQKRINELGDQLGIERDKAFQLTLQEAAELDHNRATAKELERITLERDAARAEAERTAAALAQASAERKAALEKQDELEDAVEALRVNAGMNAAAAHHKESERSTLAGRIAELEAACAAAEEEAEHARSANELTAAQEERARDDALRRAQQLSQLNTEMERIEEQCEAAECARVEAVSALRGAEVELEERNEALAEMEQRVAEARAHSDSVQGDLADAQRRAAELHARVHALAAERDALRAAQEAADANRERIEREIGAENAALRDKLEQSEALLVRARQEAASEMADARCALDAATDDTERSALRAALEERERASAAQLDEMRAIDAQMREMQAEARSAADAAERERAQLSSDLAAARRQAAEAAAIAEQNRLAAEQWSATYARETEELRRAAEEKADLYERASRELAEFRDNNSELQRDVDAHEAEIVRLRAEMERTQKVYRTMAERATAAAPSAAAQLSPRRSRSGSVSDLLSRRSSKLKHGALASVQPPDIQISSPHGGCGGGGDDASGSEGDSSVLPRSQPATPREQAATNTMLRLRIDPGREQRLLTMEANLRRNEALWATLVKAVETGDITTLRSAFHLGVSPNTVDPVKHQVLLEICVRACSQTYSALGHRHGTDATQQLDKLQRALSFLIEHGAEWPAIDSAVATGYADGSLPLADETRVIVERRDDHSPFVRSLVDNDATRFAELIDGVADIDRVPQLNDKRLAGHGYSFLHIAVLNAETPKGTWRGGKSGTLPAIGSDLMVYNLVRRGALCTTTDNMERTALHLALMHAASIERETLLRVVEYLMAGGADPDEICPSKEYQAVASDGATKKSVLHKVSSRKKSSASKHERRQENARRYGSALAYAKVRQDKRLIELMESRRYRRVTLETLAEYVRASVNFSCTRRALVAAGTVVAGDAFDVVCARYANTFHFFNPRLDDTLGGGERTLSVLRDAASVDDTDTDDEIDAKVCAQLERDAFFVRSVVYEMSGRCIADPETAAQARLGMVPDLDDEQRAFLESVAPIERAAMNRSQLWRACDLLEKCVQALLSKWFGVSNLVHEPAKALYGAAALSALHEFIKVDQLEAVLEMISRKDALYGDLTLATVVYDEKKYQCVDLAANYGATRCLRALLERQPERALKPGPSYRTLVNVAVQAEQPVSIVLIDKFAFEHSLCAERRPNVNSYGILRKPSQDSVLHSCVQRDLPEAGLLRWCIEHVSFHLDAVNVNGDTALACARRRQRTLGETCDPLTARAVRVCVTMLENGAALESSGGGGGSASVNAADDESVPGLAAAAAATTTTATPPPAPRATGRGSSEPFCETVCTQMSIGRGESDDSSESASVFTAATLGKPPPPLQMPPKLAHVGAGDPDDAMATAVPTPRGPVPSGTDDSDSNTDREPETPRTRERKKHRKKSSRAHRAKDGDGGGDSDKKRQHKSKRGKSRQAEV